MDVADLNPSNQAPYKRCLFEVNFDSLGLGQLVSSKAIHRLFRVAFFRLAYCQYFHCRDVVAYGRAR